MYELAMIVVQNEHAVFAGLADVLSFFVIKQGKKKIIIIKLELGTVQKNLNRLINRLI
jgi:hypothetical protein